MSNIIVKISDESCSCNSCKAINYDSNLAPLGDRERVDRLYEVHVGGIGFTVCDKCKTKLIASLQKYKNGVIKKKIKDPDLLYQIVELRPLPDYGDRIHLLEFVEMVESGCITDDDGFGELIYENKIVENSIVGPECKEVYVNPGERCCSTFKLQKLAKSLGDSVDIMWFNK